MRINGASINSIIRLGRRLYREYQKAQGQGSTSAPRGPRQGQGRGGSASGADYPGDFRGRLDPTYSPNPDGRPDPGEIVWTWVPFEEDYSRGKDRPIVLVGRDGDYLLGLMLTSKDHTNEHSQDERYLDIGSGPWDSRGRPSEVKIDRVIRVSPEKVRREGAVMERATFDRIAKAVRTR